MRVGLGPLGSPRDFQYGLVAIEAKSYTPERAEIVVSSLDQLDETGASRVFLSVTEVATASSIEIDAITVTELATRVRQKIVESDPAMSHMF